LGVREQNVEREKRGQELLILWTLIYNSPSRV